MRDKQIRISHYITQTKVLGPGNRFAVWMQGCEKKCKNCIFPDGQKLNGGFFITIGELMEHIKAQPDINGITISGGEPFLQFDALEYLVREIKKEKKYDIMLYSGYTLHEIVDRIGQQKADCFFKNIDILIDGEYIDSQNCGSIYRGSENQKIYFFTEKYLSLKDKFYQTKNRDIEFDFGKNHEIIMVGIPPKNFYHEFIANIEEESK